MEFREYIDIFRKRLNLFLAGILIFLAIGVAAKVFAPVEFESQATLNVSRKGAEKTDSYRFDHFYRLQADEKFADTVVRWLETPGMQEDIRKKAFPDQIAGVEYEITARRLSSQMIDIRVRSRSASDSEALARAVDDSVNQESEKINELQQEANWFWTIGDDPITRKVVLSWDRAIFFSLLAGLLFSFWLVLISHYFSNSNENRN